MIQLVGGVALLLFAVGTVREAVTAAYGAALRRLVASAAERRLAAFGGGLGIAVALQSSTAVALIVGSLAGRGLMTTATGLSVMLGADVGTSLVPQALTFEHGWVGPLLIAAGVALRFGAQAGRWRETGMACIGIGLLLLSLALVVEAVGPLRDSRLLAGVARALADAPVVALILGAALAWMMHSSLAVVLLVMSLAGSAAIPLPLALALVLGANVGACIPPVLVAAREGAVARRVTIGNLSIRLLGALVLLAFVEPAADILAGLESSEVRQVADFHTGFNLVLAMLFLPFTGPLAGLLERAIAADPVAQRDDQPRYLDRTALPVPAEALAAAARETMRMGDLVETMLRRSIDVLRGDDATLMHEVSEMDNAVDRLHEAIKLYLADASRTAMVPADSRRYVEILTFTINLEHIGDIIDKSLMEIAAKKIRERVSFSDEGLAEIVDIHAKVLQNMRLALNVFMSADVALARRLIGEKTFLREAELAAMDHHFARLRAGRRETIETTSMHLDIVRDLRRINAHQTSAAYPILEAAGELKPSRLG